MPPKPKFPDEIEQEITRRHHNGERIYLLAREYGVWPSRIRAAIERHGGQFIDFDYKFNEHVFDDLNSEQACYWLGFLFADGYVDSAGLSIKLAPKDKEHLVKLKQFFQAEQPIRHITEVYKGKTSHRVLLQISDKNFGLKLNSLGIITDRPDPLNALSPVPKHMLHHWFRGLFDGDGCAHKESKLTFLAPTPILVVLRNYLIDKQALALRVNAPNGSKIVEYQYISRLHFGGVHQCRRIADCLYLDATIWMPRKRLVIDGWQSRPLKRVEFRCEYCDKAFSLAPWQTRGRTVRFCSLSCSTSHNNKLRKKLK